jgi:prepilin peptidase CpaA
MDSVILATLSIILAFCMYTDYRYQRIPNDITFPSMLLALGYHSFTSGTVGLASSGAGLLLGITLLIIPYFLGGMGAGDAKLMGAIGAFTGPIGILYVFIYTAIAGGIYALLLLLFNRKFRAGFIAKHTLTLKLFVLTRKWIPDENPLVENSPKLCYGLAIAVGAYLYITETALGFNILPRNFVA